VRKINMENCRIYVITHKKITPFLEDGYKTLLVGANKNNAFENDYLLDNTGENISDLNDSYCELTGLYWIWKNAKEDIVGLVHYRRVFAVIKPHIKLIGRHIVFNNNNSYRLLTKGEIQSKLKTTDIIVKRSEYRLRTVKQIFVNQVGDKLFGQISTVIYQNEPEYKKAFIKMCNSHHHINCNMFIGKKGLIDSYCEWLFPILKSIDKMNIEETGNRYCNREIGYISELLFGVWIKKNNIRYKYEPVVVTEDPMVVNGVIGINQLASFIKSRVSKRIKKDIEHGEVQ